MGFIKLTNTKATKPIPTFLRPENIQKFDDVRGGNGELKDMNSFVVYKVNDHECMTIYVKETVQEIIEKLKEFAKASRGNQRKET